MTTANEPEPLHKFTFPAPRTWRDATEKHLQDLQRRNPGLRLAVADATRSIFHAGMTALGIAPVAAEPAADPPAPIEQSAWDDGAP